MTSSIRLHVDAQLREGGKIAPSPAQSHYLANVMRRGPGDMLRLFNGIDGEFSAQIESLRKHQAMVSVGRLVRPQNAEPDLWLVFAVLKRDATDLVVQKATELGAARLLPVSTARTNAARLNHERLAAIATEAAEQCERLSVPRIDAMTSLERVLADWPVARRLVVGMERTGSLPVRGGRQAAGFLVGPEGGFTPVELDVLRRHPFVEPATLGPLILRAETAAIVGLALLQALTDGQG